MRIRKNFLFFALTVRGKKELEMDILINGEIGGGMVTADGLRAQLGKIKDGEDARIVVNSPGGDCFEGIAVYNTIRDFARNFKGTITTYVQGMAASAASWIALAASSVSERNKVVVEDNSVFMIHDCWGLVIGNRNDMRNAADFAERVDGVMQRMLAKKSGKSEAEIGGLMDAETWYFGDEIVKAGFADELVKEKKPDGEKVETEPDSKEEPEKESADEKKKNALALAKKRYADCQNDIKADARRQTEFFKSAVAMVRDADAAEKAASEKKRIMDVAASRIAAARAILAQSL